MCRITIHVLQLNIEKAEILPLCYNLVGSLTVSFQIHFADRRGAFLCALNDCVNICNIVDFACEIRLLKGYILRMGEWHQFTMPSAPGWLHPAGSYPSQSGHG